MISLPMGNGKLLSISCIKYFVHPLRSLRNLHLLLADKPVILYSILWWLSYTIHSVFNFTTGGAITHPGIGFAALPVTLIQAPGKLCLNCPKFSTFSQVHPLSCIAPNVLYFIISLYLMPDNFTHQGRMLARLSIWRGWVGRASCVMGCASWVVRQ
jgi:hypothetical protein